MGLDIRKIEISKIKKNLKLNHHEDNDELKNKLKNQIKKNGELLPLIVVETPDKNLYLIDGFLRLLIYDELEWSHCHCSVISKKSSETLQLMRLELDIHQEIEVIKTSKLLTNIISSKRTAETIQQTIDFSATQIERYIGITDWNWDLFQIEDIPTELLINQNKTKSKKLF